MRYLYIDESYNENAFIVGGILSNTEKEIYITYNKFKKHLKNYPLTRKQKQAIMYEFKSHMLERSFPKIKKMFLEYISKANINIIYSYTKITSKLKQEKKETIYLELLENIINEINDDIIIVTFDSFNNTPF